jgi:RimJ/RimL family protein N-acetyltransferase
VQNRRVPVRPTAPPDPPLSDGVVALRPWTPADAAELVAAANDPEIARWLDRMPQPYTEADARAYVAFGERGWAGDERETPFAIVDAETGEPLGSIGVRWEPGQSVAEVGYWLRRGARGRGVAPRATRLAARWALADSGFERLELRADPLNAASCAVAERAGFTLDGTLRSVRYNARQRRRIDLRVYSILRSELPGAAA